MDILKVIIHIFMITASKSIIFSITFFFKIFSLKLFIELLRMPSRLPPLQRKNTRKIDKETIDTSLKRAEDNKEVSSFLGAPRHPK